ncbi:MAG TPA: SRPBCC domain-containing protein [Chloroflexia bacterium]|nr:SRPBCC domain-containing protein [Chloroflexia bacterium]
MSTPSTALTFTRTVQASPADVFRAFTTAAALRAWLCHAALVEPYPGGHLYLAWNQGYFAAGIFTALEPEARLAFTWQGAGDPAPTQVRITLAGIGGPDGPTTVTAVHAGIGTDAAWAEFDRQIRQGWASGLEHLQALLETGVDPRFARRPMFGLSGADELTPEGATRLGVPVAQGIWLNGLVDGMGAQAAGLQKDDVVVRLGIHAVTGWPSFTAALQAHRAGDRVPVVFYRGPQEHTVTIELSRRPIAAAPESLAALVATARTTYAALDTEVTALCAGAAEAAAEHRPAPDEWNAKEAMAHLIAGERDVHTWLATAMEGGDVENTFRANLLPRLQALVAVYPTLAALLEEFRRSQAATIAMLAALPPAIGRRKDLLVRLNGWLGEGTAQHSREHFQSIQQLLAEAPAPATPRD